VVVHEVSHRPVRRGKKMPKKSAMFGLKWGAFPLLDNKEYNSRIENWLLGQLLQGFRGYLTSRKKTRNLLSVEFKKYTGLFFIAPS